MKKLLVIASLLGLTLNVGAATIATNMPTAALHLLSTNRASVYSIELTSTNSATVYLYDCDRVAYSATAGNCWGYQYTNASYITVVQQPSTNVLNYVGYNGYTNWYTNVGASVTFSTNAIATNNLPIIGAFAIAPNTYAVYNTEMLFSRGLIATSSAANVSIVVNYRTAQ